MSDTIKVTGLTPDPALTPPEPAPAPAAPPAKPPEPPTAEAGEAQPPEQPADGEEASQEATAQTPVASSEQAPEGDGTPPPKKPARGVQKALDRLAGQRDQALEAAQRATQERDALAAAVQRLLEQGKQAPAAKVEPPKPEAFSNALDYQRAVARFEATQAAQGAVREGLGQFVGSVLQQANTNAAKAHETALNAKYAEALQTAPERFEDWEDTVIASDLPVPPSLELAIKGSNDPAAVLHYLATNPQVHTSLINLPPWQQALEVGRLSGQMQPRPVPSKAPPPAKPIGGKTVPAGPNPDDMSPAQWRAYLAKNGMTRGLR